MIAQPQQESHSLNRFANCNWIGFLDVDEFLRLPGRTLPAFLGDFATAEADGLSFGLRWFNYKGVLDFDEIITPPLTFLHGRRDEGARKRQKLFVRPRQVRFLRLHNLEDGKHELQVDDSDIFFHHYCQRDYRFGERDKEKTVPDDYMLRFASQLEQGIAAPERRQRPQTEEQWIDHIIRAIALAEAGLSRLTDEALSIQGLSGTITRHFYNNLCNFRECRFLEIGSFKGASTVAALFDNDVSATCIDNFSQFRGARGPFEANIEQFHLRASIRLIDRDCFEVDSDELGPFDVYLYDGGHTRRSHYLAIERFVATLAPLAVLVIDDWNWDRVREGTNQALQDLGISVLYKKEIILPEDDVKGMPRHRGRHSWWNGTCIMLLERPKQDLQFEPLPRDRLDLDIFHELQSVSAVEPPRELSSWLKRRFIADIRGHQPRLRDVTPKLGWSNRTEVHQGWQFLVEAALQRIRDRRIDCSFQVSFDDRNGEPGARSVQMAHAGSLFPAGGNRPAAPFFRSFVHASNLHSGYYEELRKNAGRQSFTSRREGILWRGSMSNPIRARLVQLADKIGPAWTRRFSRIKSD